VSKVRTCLGLVYVYGTYGTRAGGVVVATQHEQALVSLKIKETVDAVGWCTKDRYN